MKSQLPVNFSYLWFNYSYSSMNSPEIKQFIRQHSNLFWYTPEDIKEDISPEFLVETILNYGDLNDVRNLVHIMGFDQFSEVFNNAQGRKKLNYYPEIYNFFSILIQRYAHSNI